MAVDYLFKVADYALSLKADGYCSPRQTRRSPSVVYWFVLLTLAVTVAAFAFSLPRRKPPPLRRVTSRAVQSRRCPPRRVTAPGKMWDVPRALL